MYFASSIAWTDTLWRQRLICPRKLEKTIDDLCGHLMVWLLLVFDDDDDDDDDGSHAPSQTIRRRHSPSPVERTSRDLMNDFKIQRILPKITEKKLSLLFQPFFLFFSVPLITTGWWIFLVFRKQCFSLQIGAWMGKASVLCVCGHGKWWNPEAPPRPMPPFPLE